MSSELLLSSVLAIGLFMVVAWPVWLGVVIPTLQDTLGDVPKDINCQMLMNWGLDEGSRKSPEGSVIIFLSEGGGDNCV